MLTITSLISYEKYLKPKKPVKAKTGATSMKIRRDRARAAGKCGQCLCRVPSAPTKRTCDYCIEKIAAKTLAKAQAAQAT